MLGRCGHGGDDARAAVDTVEPKMIPAKRLLNGRPQLIGILRLMGNRDLPRSHVVGSLGAQATHRETDGRDDREYLDTTD
jgi:hypothetical protein